MDKARRVEARERCHATLGDGRNAVRIIEESLCKRAKIRGEQQPVSIPQWENSFRIGRQGATSISFDSRALACSLMW